MGLVSPKCLPRLQAREGWTRGAENLHACLPHRPRLPGPTWTQPRVGSQARRAGPSTSGPPRSRPPWTHRWGGHAPTDLPWVPDGPPLELCSPGLPTEGALAAYFSSHLGHARPPPPHAENVSLKQPRCFHPWTFGGSPCCVFKCPKRWLCSLGNISAPGCFLLLTPHHCSHVNRGPSQPSEGCCQGAPPPPPAPPSQPPPVPGCGLPLSTLYQAPDTQLISVSPGSA